MFTGCPQCQTTFRVTAALLRQARGQVKCGGCGATFDALENLSEETPAAASRTSESKRFVEKRSKELLKALGEITGTDDVRIEDTGIEWQVLDTDSVNDDDPQSQSSRKVTPRHSTSATSRKAAAARASYGRRSHDQSGAADSRQEPNVDLSSADKDVDWAEVSVAGLEVSEFQDSEDVVLSAEEEDDSEASTDSQTGNPAGAVASATKEELRFDDYTPLPDEYFRPLSGLQFDSEQETSDKAADEDAAKIAALRVAIDTGTEADWQDLLEVVGNPDEAAVATGAHHDGESDKTRKPGQAGTPEDDSAAQDSSSGDTANSANAAPQRASADVRSDGRTGQRAEAKHAIDLGGTESAAQTASASLANAARLVPHGRQREEVARNRTGYSSSQEDYETDDTLVESIVMEGDTVTDLLETAERASYDNIPEPELDDDLPLLTPVLKKRQKSVLMVGVGIAAILCVTLAAQYVHANRETLATKPLFQNTLAPLYEVLGEPVAPAWNIRGWRFESTNGSTDDADQNLTIFSRIANESAADLPYPLIHVSLTDRWDDVIGSRVLAPGDYLAGGGDASKPVAAGAAFAAVITVTAPAASATGFKLNVCYPLNGQRLRCAIEDFRE